MVENQSTFCILSSSAFETLRVRGKRIKKSRFLDNFFHFQIFETCENVKIDLASRF